MPIPQETEIRRPLLEVVKGENPHNLSARDLLIIITEHFGEDENELSPIDKNILKSRILSARKYLERHELISNPSSNTYMITKLGVEILSRTSGVIDDESLKNFSVESLPLELVVSAPEEASTDSLPEDIDHTEEASNDSLTEETDLTEQASTDSLHEETDLTEQTSFDSLTEETDTTEEASIDSLTDETDTTEEASIDSLTEETDTTEQTSFDTLPDEIDLTEEASLGTLHDETDTTEEASLDSLTEETDHTEEASNDSLTEETDLTEQTSFDSLTEETDTTEQASNDSLHDETDTTEQTSNDSLTEETDLTEQASNDSLTEETDTTEEASLDELPDNIDMSEPEKEYIPEEVIEGEDIMPEEDFSPEEYSEEEVTHYSSIENVLAQHDSELADKVLSRVANLPADTFEVLVIDLLSKMGYRAFQNARFTNDESDNGMIQGVILDTQNPTPIYIHAKKLAPGRTVGRADIQDFVEALTDKGGKGIFATAADFSDNAITYAQDERIMLIDGAKLAGLMIAHNFCVNVEKVFEVKEIDEDSFSDYEN